MAIFINPPFFKNNFLKKIGPDCFNSVQGQQKIFFYQNHITDATVKNHRWLNFLSNFSILGWNVEFFGPYFFTESTPQDLSCAKNLLPTLKTWFYIDFGRKLSILTDPLPLLLAPCPARYDPNLTRTNFIWSEMDR